MDEGIVFRLAYLLLVTCLVAQGWQQEAGSADAGLEKDVYAIYSLMLTDPETSHSQDPNERYLIKATTASVLPGPMGLARCVRPPAEYEADFQAVLADYERRKDIPRELRRELSIRKPYELLSADEAKAFQDGYRSRYPGATDIFTLSDVYFNRDRTLALAYISSWCNALCGLSQWKVFEKLDSGAWVERDWANCVMISTNSEPSR
jgi:hypothetical protein